MANTKISALTTATIPVVGTEVLPIVQSSATKQLSIANLTPGLNTITAAKGGTGQTSFAVGDLLYADTTTTLAKLADVATGNAVISGGVGVAPSYGKIGLTTHVSGILPVANGGTNASTASITSFNNITGYTASGATGTTSTNLVFSTSPSITTPTLVGNATLSTGNIVQGTAAKGIDFTANTPAAGKTSQLLNWYEEGTWTPVLTANTSGTITITSPTNSVNYTRVGRLVTLTGRIVISSVSLPLGLLILTGFPFASGGTASKNSGAGAIYGDTLTAASALSFRIAEGATGGIIATPNQGDAAPLMQAGSTLYINIAYTV
jgi:hypothetical protein